MSQLWGVLALRLSNADLLPFDFGSYADNIRQFVEDLSGDASKKDSTKRDLSQLDIASLQNRIREFGDAGRVLNKSLLAALAAGDFRNETANSLNHGMMRVERNWLNPDGIPGRPWFKHTLYGARYTYAHLELPGLTEAVEKGDWDTARQQAQTLERALEKNTQLLNELNSLARESASKPVADKLQ